MANKQEKDIKTEANEAKTELSAPAEKKETAELAKTDEPKGLVGWFKDRSMPVKVGLITLGTAVIGGIGWGVKTLIDAFMKSGDDDSSEDAESESPFDE